MMVRAVIISAVLTGVFCGGFALFIDLATDMLDRGHVVLISFCSGFLGSLFAQIVLKRMGKSVKQGH